jgi:Uma2 family endonuclease
MEPQRKTETPYTVAEYMAWPDSVRCELIDGMIYDMSPAPVIEHQRLVGTLHYELRQALEKRRGEGGDGGCSGCELFIAPIDVVLGPNTVVQPDLIVVCDPAKLANGRYVDGAPEWVAEILSPSTAVKDKREKLRLYERHRVSEYLIIDPHERYAERYRLNPEGRYGLPDILGSRDTLELLLFHGFERTLGELFGWPADDLDISTLG